MDEQDLISKKELLQLTGISYGQLYRWKRENLIPEGWFIKKSSFTGQETFFPREKIIKRTNMIIELKDKYSLEELNRIFSPESTNRSFKLSDIEEMKGMREEVLENFSRILDKKHFSFTELTFIYLVSRMEEENLLKSGDAWNLAESIGVWLPELKNISYSFLLCRNQNGAFSLLMEQEAKVFLDKGTRILKRINLDEMAKELNESLSELGEGLEGGQ